MTIRLMNGTLKCGLFSLTPHQHIRKPQCQGISISNSRLWKSVINRNSKRKVNPTGKFALLLSKLENTISKSRCDIPPPFPVGELISSVRAKRKTRRALCVEVANTTSVMMTAQPTCQLVTIWHGIIQRTKK